MGPKAKKAKGDYDINPTETNENTQVEETVNSEDLKSLDINPFAPKHAHVRSRKSRNTHMCGFIVWSKKRSLEERRFIFQLSNRDFRNLREKIQ